MRGDRGDRDRDRDFGRDRKRRYSDVLKDPYKGPQQFLEAGVRGFLLTCQQDREEYAVDEAIKVLRKTCVKLYGGIKPLKPEDAAFARGYIMVDFMNPEDIQYIPHPDADKLAEEEAAKETEEGAKEETDAKDEAKEEVEEKEEAAAEAEESKQEDTEKPEGEGKDKDKEASPKKPRREEERRQRRPLLLSTHKFQSYRTELRNMMFVKSDIADPVEVLSEAFDLMSKRKPLIADVINQILPVQGVCDNDYKQLEIMCRRVLAPYFSEEVYPEEPPSFGLLFLDKMCEPGGEVLTEVVRSAIWSINPSAWQNSPWCEPDVVVHVEIIGSKIILCAMPRYMKYRQYSPLAVYELGYGKPEDEDKLLRGLKRSDEDEENRKNRKKDKDKRGKDKADEKTAEENKDEAATAEGAETTTAEGAETTEGDNGEATEEAAAEES